MDKKVERTYATHDEVLIDKASLRESEKKLHAIISALESLRLNYKNIKGHSIGVFNALTAMGEEAERIERDMRRRHPHRSDKYEWR